MKLIALISWIPVIRRALETEKMSRIPTCAFLTEEQEILLVQSDDIRNRVELPQWFLGEIYYHSGKFDHGYAIHLGIQTDLIRDGETYAIGWNGCEEDMGPTKYLRPGDILQFHKCEEWSKKESPSCKEVKVLGVPRSPIYHASA